MNARLIERKGGIILSASALHLKLREPLKAKIHILHEDRSEEEKDARSKEAMLNRKCLK